MGVEEAEMASSKKGIRMESETMNSELTNDPVAKTSQEQESCLALQLTSWVPLGHPPNSPEYSLICKIKVRSIW